MSQSISTHRDLVLPPRVTEPAKPSADTPTPWSRFWQWLRRAAPTAGVIAMLAGLAFWGHSTDWTLPKFSALIGNGVAAPEDWCLEHNVPESQCIECNKSLLPPHKDTGWCKEHGIAPCPLHDPSVSQLKTIPAVTSEDIERASRALALRPRAENNSLCKLHERHIQFASIEAMQKAGVDIAVAQQRPIMEAIVANGEVIYDETGTAHLASRVTGTVWRVDKQVGDRVKKGDILALIDAADVGIAKAELLQAIAQARLKRTSVEQLRPLADGAIAGKQLLEAEAALQEAEIKLRRTQQALVNLGLPVRADDFKNATTDEISERIQFLGLPPGTVSSHDAESTTSNLFPLRSPLDGVIVARKIVAGEVVNSTTSLFSVADVRQMWLMLDVRQDEAKFLSLGQTVLFRPSDAKNEAEIKGSLAWISTAADDETRTVKVRVNLPNSDGKLRANTFGTGRIVLREEPRAVMVPSEAVHSDGDCNIVFVRDKDFLRDGAFKYFHIRKVRLGVKDGDTTEIIAGLLPGEVIASKNSVVLEAQLLKSNLGAGCGCADGH